MTPVERAAFRDGGRIPAGWRWCPDCNGEGVVSWVSRAWPHHETQEDCTRCEAELGIVPVEPAGESTP